MPARVHRVAIVGLGPKGLFALERLLDRAASLEAGAALRVDVFEPHPVPGAGPVYDPEQPSYLRMNIPDRSVDMWAGVSAVVPPGERLPFAADDPRTGDAYAARADVGRYLARGLATLLRRLPPGVEVELRRARVDTIRRRGPVWEVVAGGRGRSYDDVLVAMGHDSGEDGTLAARWRHDAPLVPAVFPVSRHLAVERVPAGSTVAIRGFALTFIDAALALTEGRGGRFEPLDHPYRLRYVAGDADAGLILPFSRTGRAMRAKPRSGLTAGSAALANVAEDGRAQILALPTPVSLDRLLAVLVRSATAAARHAGSHHPDGPRGSGDRRPPGPAELGAWLVAAVAGTLPGEDPASALERSLAVGFGLHPSDEQWALGHVWRVLYPALVERLGDDGLRRSDWPAFLRLATEMERIAFGPAPGNVAKLLALVDAGKVDLSFVQGGRLHSGAGGTLLQRGGRERAVDVVVDAVLPGPGAGDLARTPLAELVASGDVRRAPGRRGLDVDRSGACRGADGRVREGLSAIGRVTEDVVIGNDTLNRALHPLAERWAHAVVLRAVGRAEAPLMAGAR